VRTELAEAQERAQIGEAIFSRSLAADNAEHQVPTLHHLNQQMQVCKLQGMHAAGVWRVLYISPRAAVHHPGSLTTWTMLLLQVAQLQQASERAQLGTAAITAKLAAAHAQVVSAAPKCLVPASLCHVPHAIWLDSS
jgi:hypothetical protein